MFRWFKSKEQNDVDVRNVHLYSANNKWFIRRYLNGRFLYLSNSNLYWWPEDHAMEYCAHDNECSARDCLPKIVKI